MKSPEQKVVEARAALTRAVERMRREDTRKKIVGGALALEFIDANMSRLGVHFLSFINSKKHRDSDMYIIDSLRRELTRPQQNPPEPRPAPAAATQTEGQKNQAGAQQPVSQQ